MLFTVKVAVCATVLFSILFPLLAEDQIELPTSTDSSRIATPSSEKHQRLLNLLNVTKKITDQGRPTSYDFGKWNSEYAKKKIEESTSYHRNWPNFDEHRKLFDELRRNEEEYKKWSKIDLKAFTMENNS